MDTNIYHINLIMVGLSKGGYWYIQKMHTKVKEKRKKKSREKNERFVKKKYGIWVIINFVVNRM